MLVLAAGATGGSGCAPDLSSSAFVRTCVLNEDQVGTFDGRWMVGPIALAVQQGAFSETEKTIIRSAAEQWNAFARVSLGMDLFSIGSGSMPEIEAVSSVTDCSPGPGQAPIQNGAFANPLVIFKLAGTSWSSAFPSAPSAIAITSTCPFESNPIAQFIGGKIDLNYQNFFVAGQRKPDLKSILVHELGHLIGLGHSCESAPNRGGVPACSQAGINSTYLKAVMYPAFTFDSSGRGEVRFRLNQNDQGRANCLYLPVFNP